MIDSNYESSSGEEDEDGEEEYVEKIEFTEWFPPDRWARKNIVIYDTTYSIFISETDDYFNFFYLIGGRLMKR